MTAVLSSIPGLAILWLVFTVPLAVFRAGNDYVITPKIALAMAGVLAAWCALAQTAKWRAAPRQPLFLPLAAYVVACLVSVPGAVNFPQANRLALEQAGWAALALVAAAAPVGRRRFLAVTAAAVAVQLFVAFLQSSGRWVVGHGEVFGAGRIYATLGNPSYFGIYLAPVAVMFASSLAAELRARRTGQACWQATALAAILYLLYRAAVIDAWAGLALGGAVALFLLWRAGSGEKLGRGAWIAGSTVFLLGVWGAFSVLLPRLGDRLDYLKVKAFSWHAAAWLWREHPVLGAGPGGFQTGAPDIMSRVHALWTSQWGVPPMFVSPHDEAFAHQDFIQMLAETGVAGFGLWIWAVVVAIRVAMASMGRDREGGVWRVACLGALASFLPTMCLHFPLHLAPSALIFWLCLGLAGRTDSPSDGGRSTPVWARLLAALAAVLAFIPVARSWTSNAYLGTGYRMFLGGAPQEAVPWFDRFRVLDPAHYEGRFYAGALFQALGDDARALEEYGAATSLYPGMQGAVYNLGNLAYRRGKYGEAVSRYTRVLEINPCMVEALNNRGNAYAAMDRNKDAVREYLRAVSLKPSYADALYNLAITLYREGDRKGAKTWLERTLAADPAYPQAEELAGSLGVKMQKRKAGR